MELVAGLSGAVGRKYNPSLHPKSVVAEEQSSLLPAKQSPVVPDKESEEALVEGLFLQINEQLQLLPQQAVAQPNQFAVEVPDEAVEYRRLQLRLKALSNGDEEEGEVSVNVVVVEAS